MSSFVKKLPKYIGIIIVLILVLVLLFLIAGWTKYKLAERKYTGMLGDTAPSLTHQGFEYRDLNKNGALDVYEDSRQSIEARVNDLMGQMTLEEKAGVMFITFTPAGMNGEIVNTPKLSDPFTLAFPMNSELLVGKKMNHFSLAHTVEDTAMFGTWHNKLQKMAERTRLGIPVTLASDPRHGVGTGGGVALPSGVFSKWPDALGLAATRDAELVRNFGDIARQEYRAVGIHLSLHPTADLATDPRWARNGSTFGEDAELAAELVGAYVRGFQGKNVGPQSVTTMVKHFSGGGPQKDGEDAHFTYGKEQVYPGNNFDYHIIPFEKGAFPANASQIMPYYGIPVGQTNEDVGFAYNKKIITALLREKYGFDGVICTDWGLITDQKMLGKVILPARAWGVEHLSHEERMLKIIDAGNDQIGGEHLPEMLVKLVNEGKITEDRIDQSVRRILLDKFRLGLFDNPYLDIDESIDIVGAENFVSAGIDAQRKSLVLLKNGDSKPTLPLRVKPKIYIENIDAEIAASYGDVVETPQQADFAIIRIAAPFEPREGFFDSIFHAGDLDFKGEEKARLLSLLEITPTIVDIYLDRPAVIPEVADKSSALIASFGVQDDILMNMIFGKSSPSGKLPFEMPSSMDAVKAQFEDLPYDSKNPLFPFGHGLTYEIQESE